MFSLPFVTPRSPTAYKRTRRQGPVLRSGNFTPTKTGDTHLEMRDWGKGSVWINGHSLRRYWSVGSQQTLYVPAECLKMGDNTISVPELLKTETKEIITTMTQILDELKN